MVHNKEHKGAAPPTRALTTLLIKGKRGSEGEEGRRDGRCKKGGRLGAVGRLGEENERNGEMNEEKLSSYKQVGEKSES